MADPFKTIFNQDLVVKMASVLTRVSADFKEASFLDHALSGLDDLEMMARAEKISVALEKGLGPSFLANLKVLIAALHPCKTSELSDMETDELGIAGWAIVPLGSYVARCGMAQPDESMDALREMTMRFSAEFAVRFFLRDHPDLALNRVMSLAHDPNPHVRRLASEGTRPLLPWGIKLHRFVEDPTPLLPLLTQLRDDPSDYVRKSVANNLNDISKSHPDLVADLAADWLEDASSDRRKLVKHACRTLIKRGHPKGLAAFGYGPPKLSDIYLDVPKSVQLGEVMPIAFGFRSDKSQSLLIDYAVYFMRANGKLSPKVFKWNEISAARGERKAITKAHPYKPVTTRKDYEGRQVLSVQVNGVEVACVDFEFTI